VRWIADRSEAFLADYHGRDNISHAALALDKDGRFLGLQVSTLAGLGGCLAPKGPLSPTSNIPALSRPGEAEPRARTSPSDRSLGRPARLPGK
jgi:carbon-monoxide dehydrogenase large subunit